MLVKSIFPTETVHPKYGKLFPNALLEINSKDYADRLFEPALQVQCLSPKCGSIYLFDWNLDGRFIAKPCPRCGMSVVKFIEDKIYAIEEVTETHNISIPSTFTVSIIILCMNNLEYTKKCIESIRKNTTVPYQLVVVDNGSIDETPQYLRSIMADDKDILIRLHKNIGFGPGNNLASKVVKTEYICLVNNDCEVEEGWLEQLIEASKKGGLIGASMNFLEPNRKDKRFDHVGIRKTNWGYIEGWCLLIKRSLFESIGGFDEQFIPVLYEDADLSFKVKEFGINLYAISNPKIIHHGNKTLSKLSGISQFSVRNSILLYNKWVENKSNLGIQFDKIEKTLPRRKETVYEKIVLTKL